MGEREQVYKLGIMDVKVIHEGRVSEVGVADS